MPSQDPRTELRMIQDEIDLLNEEKAGLDRLWNAETAGLGLCSLLEHKKTSKTLQQLQQVNKHLAAWYGMRNALLKEYPALQREFGGPRDHDTFKRFRSTNPMETQAARTAADRHRRKRAIHPDFKAWCAAQQPQIKASLERWEDPAIRGRFQADRRTRSAPEETAPVEPRKPLFIRGPIPQDLDLFLEEMGDPLAGRSYNRLEDYWQNNETVRELYALWSAERVKAETPT